MGISWLRRTRGDGPNPRPRRIFRAEVSPLEDRRLPAIALTTATAHPQILIPPNGRYVPVTISGEITQQLLDTVPGATVKPPPAAYNAILAQLDKEPMPRAFSFVIDEYRRDEPRVTLTLHEDATSNFFTPANVGNPDGFVGLDRRYAYTFTIYLQAQRSTRTKDGRQYDVTIAAGDEDGGGGTTIAVLVPKDRQQLLPHAHGSRSGTATK